MRTRPLNAKTTAFLSCLLLTTLTVMVGCSADRTVRNQPANGQPLNALPRPNIVYILADDLGYGDLGCYGQQLIATPNLDNLAANGLRFTDHYAGATVCAPSRCVLMTGKHNGVGFTRGNYHAADGYALPMPADEPSLARVLHESGYATALIGKWGLGGPDSTSHPNAVGFDFFYGFLDQRHAHNHYPDYLWRNNEREATGNVMTDASRIGPLGAGVATERHAYANDLFFEESQKWIAEQARTDQPFFLYLALTVPHANNEAPRLLQQMPEWGRPQRGQEVPDLGDYANREGWPGPNQGTAAMITRFDAQIGELVEQLRELGIEENTLVMFSSDNGPHAEGGNQPDFFDSNGPYRGIKRDLYDGGIRVPMIAYWPGTVPTGTTGHVSSFEDILPTVAELAHAPVPPSVTGISFVPVLVGEGSQAQHDYLYWEFYEQGGKQAVRLGQWKGIRLHVNNDADGPIMLFNLNTDPGEQTDVAEQNPDVVAQIRTIMQEAHTRSGLPAYQFQWERE